MNAPVVIVGTGLAGYNLAREFRKLDSETPLLLITISSEEEARRTIGILVVAGMVALILKGLLIARWVKARKKARERRQDGNPE